jgi:hypothetical protein
MEQRHLVMGEIKIYGNSGEERHETVKEAGMFYAWVL